MFHLRFLHNFISKVNVSFSILITLPHHKVSFSSVTKTVAASNVYTILLNISPLLVSPILCEAYENKLIWPKYTWILHSYQFNDIPQDLTQNKDCSIQNKIIMEGLFIFQLIQLEEEMTYELRNVRSNMEES